MKSCSKKPWDYTACLDNMETSCFVAMNAKHDMLISYIIFWSINLFIWFLFDILQANSAIPKGVRISRLRTEL